MLPNWWYMSLHCPHTACVKSRLGRWVAAQSVSAPATYPAPAQTALCPVRSGPSLLRLASSSKGWVTLVTAQPPPKTLSLEMARIRSSSLMGSDLDPRRLYTTGQRFVSCPESGVGCQIMPLMVAQAHYLVVRQDEDSQAPVVGTWVW